MFQHETMIPECNPGGKDDCERIASGMPRARRVCGLVERPVRPRRSFFPSAAVRREITIFDERLVEPGKCVCLLQCARRGASRINLPAHYRTFKRDTLFPFRVKYGTERCERENLLYQMRRGLTLELTSSAASAEQGRAACLPLPCKTMIADFTILC